MRHAANRDLNHTAIVEALRDCGCSVHAISSHEAGCPDILVGCQRVTYLLELKSGNNQPSEAQRLWYARWKGGPLFVVHSPEEALAAVGLKREGT